MAMKKPRPTQLVHMRLDRTLLKRLDDFRFDNRLESRSEAARRLLIWALDQEPSLPMKTMGPAESSAIAKEAAAKAAEVRSKKAKRKSAAPK